MFRLDNLRWYSVLAPLAAIALATSACEPGAQGSDESSPADDDVSAEGAEDGEEEEAQAQAGGERNTAGSGKFVAEHERFWPAMAHSELNPEAVPPGANLKDCKLSDAHPRPVILVHGTWVNQYDSFAKMAPTLANEGYCVYTLNFGRKKDADPGLLKARFGVAPVMESVLELRDFVDKVRKDTGAKKVDMVGWSQGGVLIQAYMKYQGGADRENPEKNIVNHVISLGAPHHGTSLSGMAVLANALGITKAAGSVLGVGPTDQALGSDFIKKLNEGGDTMPGVEYTSIFTTYDQIVNPVWTSVLEAGPGAKVTNISLQNGCLVDFSDHLTLPFTNRVNGFVLRALDPEYSKRVPCEWVLGSL